jgi:hypothetical protein
VWTWGGGDHGQLGHGDVAERLIPTKVAGVEGIGKGEREKEGSIPKTYVPKYAGRTHVRMQEYMLPVTVRMYVLYFNGGGEERPETKI